jgi:hypothetical protein
MQDCAIARCSVEFDSPAPYFIMLSPSEGFMELIAPCIYGIGLLAIAAGLFAIAGQISRLRETIDQIIVRDASDAHKKSLSIKTK